MSIPGLGGGGGSSSGGSTQTTTRQERSGLSSNAAQNLSEYIDPLLRQQVIPGMVGSLATRFETPKLGPSGMYATDEAAVDELLNNAMASRGANLARRGFVGTNSPALAANLGSRDVLEGIFPQVGKNVLEAFIRPEVVRRERLAQLADLFGPTITGLLGERSSSSTTGASGGSGFGFQLTPGPQKTDTNKTPPMDGKG